jgi:hypothetical protein
MTKKLSVILLAAFLLFRSPAIWAFASEGVLYEIRLPFEVGAQVSVLMPDGSERALGQVVELPQTTRWPGYTASAWGSPGAVTASAVNAVHILISVESGQGRTMSVLPAETIAPAAGSGAAIVLACPAGASFFGAWAPPVGTKITVLTGDGSSHPLEDRLPREGDILVFPVHERSAPYMVDFENRPGGRVTAWSPGKAEVIARVIRPLGGVGRFEGTLYQWDSRIRANHSGVIDVSTSPYGTIGGFQIIPWDHALNSKEMQGAWNATQWMIIGSEDGAMLGGTEPLFSGGLTPGPSRGEKLWDLWSTYGRKSLVLARINGGDWTKLPVVSGKADDALKSVTHLRIYFPSSKEPLADSR